MMKVFIIVLLLLVAGTGGFLLAKKGLTVSFDNATPTSKTAMPTSTTINPNPTNAQPLLTVTPTNQQSKDTLIAAVKAGIIAEHGQDAASMTVTVSSIEGDYAKGLASAGAGGAIWFAAKTTGSWKLIWDGNGIIDCNVISPYPKFPTSLLPSCYDYSTNQSVTR